MAGMSETVNGLQYGTIWLLQYNTEIHLNIRQIAKTPTKWPPIFQNWTADLSETVCSVLKRTDMWPHRILVLHSEIHFKILKNIQKTMNLWNGAPEVKRT